MTVRVVTLIAAAVVLGFGTWVELRYRKSPADTTEDEEVSKDEDSPPEMTDVDEDSVADIIRQARPALERAASLRSSDPAAEGR
jgi:hypothetical protein